MTWTIGQLARAAGTKVRTIRYYEEIGLMPKAARTAGNQRLFAEGDAERLRFIRHCRELGLSLDAVRTILAWRDQPDRPCEAVDRIAREHQQAVELRIARLQALKREFARMIADCRGGRVADCRVVAGLNDHALCQSDEH